MAWTVPRVLPGLASPEARMPVEFLTDEQAAAAYG